MLWSRRLVTLFLPLSKLLSLQTDPLIARLASVPLFAFGGVGITGRMSDGEKDFRDIMARSSALSDLEAVLKNGTLEGQCYALVGLRHLRPELYAKTAKKLATSDKAVSTMTGCLMSRSPLREVLAHIQAGIYDTSITHK